MDVADDTVVRNALARLLRDRRNAPIISGAALDAQTVRGRIAHAFGCEDRYLPDYVLVFASSLLEEAEEAIVDRQWARAVSLIADAVIALRAAEGALR